MFKKELRSPINLTTLSASVLIMFIGYSSASFALDGKGVYEKTCKTCHATGIMGAPKPCDKKDWDARSAKGMDVLAKNAIKGYKGKKGTMPPKGGNPKLSDDEIKAAIKYMLDASK